MATQSTPPGTVVIPPTSQAMVQGNGQITNPWWNFLYYLYQRTGGQTQVQSGNLANQVATLENEFTTLSTDVKNAQTAAANAEAIASAGLNFQNLGAPVGTNPTLSAQAGLLFSLSEGVMQIALSEESNIPPLAAQTLTSSPWTFTAPSRGALAVSGGQVQSITLTRQGTTIPLFP